MNVQLFRDTIAAKNSSIGKLSTALNIARSTFYRKLEKDGDTFLVKEVNIIKRELALSQDEACSIFFDDYVA